MNETMWIIIVAFVIDKKCANAKGFSYEQAYHTESKTWAAASDECDSNELEFDEKVLMKTDVLWDKAFWIGMAIYHVTTPWIEVLGCSAVPDAPEIKKEPSIVLCQKQCESYQFFGYSETTKMCSCLHDNGSSYSIKNCIEQKNSTHFFVYKVFSGIVSGYDNGKCTTVYCFDGTNGLTAVNCDDQNDETASTCNNGSIVGWGKSYSTSKQICLGSYQLLIPPETYCRLKGHENEAHYAWTNVFRAETEAKLTQAEAGTKDPLFCLAGSFTEKNDKRELNISRRVCNDQLDFFVCRAGAALSTTSKQSLSALQTPEKVSSTKRAFGVQDLKPDESSTTISRRSVTATNAMEQDSSVIFDIGPIIGGIAGAIAFLAVSVVIFCKIRSWGFFKSANTDKQEVQFSTEFYEHSQNPEVRTSETPISNESYGLASINSSNTYAVVNKIKKNGLQTTEDTYTETSYGEYDRLNGVSKRRTDSKTNLYDSHVGIRNEYDQTYDSSNHGGRRLQLDNDVYDHTDTLSTDGSDYGYSSTLKSETRNENDVYDKAV
ncbi:uncharacterized protein LOC127699925 [Mytilus californianus]|uniref:uncharacterized protein LOC127699925 n=1 Tax=Mytilus californianus TaxID=6549 RepID=UPI002247F3B6|nr:uncharacterized protein LOC127699925 [Mytilus californianus]